jgi:hypothetical protein
MIPVRAFAKLVSGLVFVMGLASATNAAAQMGGMGGMQQGGGMGGGMGGRGQQQQSRTQSSPTKSNTVGPRNAEPSAEDEEEEVHSQVSQRTEPALAPPANPLSVSPEMRARIGSDAEGAIPSPYGAIHRSYFPYYEESRGDYRFRMIPPLWLEHTRGIPTEVGSGEPVGEDRESLFAALYYQRRSPHLNVDTLFPVFWNVWNKDTGGRTTVVGPFVQRTAPFEHDNWLAPLYFEGSRKDGGYFHSPLLLTSTHSDEKGAFTWSLLYFRDRTMKDVDWGIVPFVFHGNNGNEEGARKTYTVVPPLFFYHGETEIDESQVTVVGPVITKNTPKRSIVDVAPFFFHIEGKPATGGVQETHTTLFPFFHYGKSPDQSLFVLPGYLRRVTKTADTMLTPFVSLATTRNGSTSTVAAGPIVPLYYHYVDHDIGLTTWYAAPFYLHSAGPEGTLFVTPLTGRFETYGVSRTWWFFPSLTTTTDRHGWATNLYPILYLGRTDQASHAVLAPVVWDFASPEKRTTIVAPIFWRFQDNTDRSILQIAANTLYLQKKVEGGLDWQFHLLPLFSYGEDPRGYFWNVLFGLAGFQKEGSFARIRAFWIPITVQGAASQLAEGTPALKF